jgi:hypothetical protein
MVAEHGPPADTVAEPAQHDPAERPGEKSKRQHREGQDQGDRAIVRGKELASDILGEDAVDDEVIELE